MENMKRITYLELLQMIKEDKQPKTIITKSDGETHKYTYGGGKYMDNAGKSFKYDWAFRAYSPKRHAMKPFIYYEDEILDNAEKRYLKGVIRPFRGVVKSIKKVDLPSKRESIHIEMIYHPAVVLPSFTEKTMYKGMELNRHYTLEELGL